ncbi:MAG TPA: hypothetical protein PKA64_12695, partial [Myxococcota bacterium]|nr:hypothetical protein [Myxococcota bacterium]
MPASSARARWSAVVRELEVSGLPLREFASRRAIRPGPLSSWPGTRVQELTPKAWQLARSHPR